MNRFVAHERALALLVLPLLIKHLIKVKPGNWRPMPLDTYQSFIQNVKVNMFKVYVQLLYNLIINRFKGKIFISEAQ